MIATTTAAIGPGWAAAGRPMSVDPFWRTPFAAGDADAIVAFCAAQRVRTTTVFSSCCCWS